MTILLVRHAESAANFDQTIYDTTPDYDIALTDKGMQQTVELGHFLKDWYANNPPQKNIRLWCSPYKRTLQTLMGMKEAMGEWAWDKCGRGKDIHFDDRLREREWGIYSHHQYYTEDGKMAEHFPQHLEHFKKQRAEGGGMGFHFARPYGGESLADVTLRLHSFFHDLYHDIDHGITDHLIVMHGMALRSFVLAFTKTHPAFIKEEIKTEVANTGVRLLDIDPKNKRYADYGVIYDPDSNIYLTEKPPHPIERDLNKLLA